MGIWLTRLDRLKRNSAPESPSLWTPTLRRRGRSRFPERPLASRLVFVPQLCGGPRMHLALSPPNPHPLPGCIKKEREKKKKKQEIREVVPLPARPGLCGLHRPQTLSQFFQRFPPKTSLDPHPRQAGGKKALGPAS